MLWRPLIPNNIFVVSLSGTIYKTTIIPSKTFCVLCVILSPFGQSEAKVSFGQSEAKIEAIMNDFIQLKAQSNVYEAETMVEGQDFLS
ncbi:DNA-binding protein BIN4, partial [Tanacetum coccineum]